MDMRPSLATGIDGPRLQARDGALRTARGMHDRSLLPIDDYADLQLQDCSPSASPIYGGLGADFETYCLVAETNCPCNASTPSLQYARPHDADDGPLMQGIDLPPEVRERHEQLSARRYREVVAQGAFYGQPIASRLSPAAQTS